MIPSAPPRYKVTPSDFEYMNEEAVEEELKCTICTQPLQAPVSIKPCGHIFCQICITKWLLNKKTCPQCRHPFSRNSLELVSTRNFLNMLDNILVSCTHCMGSNIHRGDMASHLQQCPQVIIKCPAVDIKCSWAGPRIEMTQHLRRCSFQKLRPIIETLQNEMRSQALQQKNICTRLQNELTKANREQQNICTRLQSQLNRVNEQLQEQKRFIQAFLNGGHPMSDYCIASSSQQCEVMNRIKDARGGTSDQRILGSRERLYEALCLVCKRQVSLNSLSLHHCDGGCICKSCVEKYCESSTGGRHVNWPGQQNIYTQAPSIYLKRSNTQVNLYNLRAD